MVLLTRKEAIEYLRISERLMCQLTAGREIAYIQYHRNGNMYFRPEDLDAYIESKRVSPTVELAAKLSILPGGDTLRRKRA